MPEGGALARPTSSTPRAAAARGRASKSSTRAPAIPLKFTYEPFSERSRGATQIRAQAAHERSPEGGIGRAPMVGQILFYHFGRPVLMRLFPEKKFDASIVDEIAEHIAAFSSAALEAEAKRGKNGRR